MQDTIHIGGGGGVTFDPNSGAFEAGGDDHAGFGIGQKLQIVLKVYTK